MCKKLCALFISLILLTLSACSNATSGVIESDSAYRSVKSTSGTTAEGNYTIELGEGSDSGVIRKTLSFGLTEEDGTHYAFSIIKNTSDNKISYQMMIAAGSTSAIAEETYSSYSVVSTADKKTDFALSDISISSDSKPDSSGYYYLCALGTLSSSDFAKMKNLTGLTVTMKGNSSVSFTVPYAFIYGLTAYL